MSEVLESIVKLIKKNKNNDEICRALNISKRELYNYLTSLRNIGYNYDKSYNIDGTISYKPQTSYKSIEEGLIEIQGIEDKDKLKMLITSDWHIGNEYTRKDLREKLPEYCYENDIHLILNTGDFINGNYGRGNKKEDALTQVRTFGREFNANNILMFGSLGDHDTSVLFGEGVNIKRYFDSYNQDIITEYNNLYIKFRGDLICLHHRVKKGNKNARNAKICLIGHSHKYTVSENNDGISEITVPSLSDLIESLPSFLEGTIIFKDDYISTLILRQMIFVEDPKEISKISIPLRRRR